MGCLSESTAFVLRVLVRNRVFAGTDLVSLDVYHDL
jgi:hypothetical protein